MNFREFYNYCYLVEHNKIQTPAIFHVGDKVRITSVINCEYGFNSTMLELVGRKTVITGISLTFNKNNKLRVRYKVQIDENLYDWSANCFETVGSKFIMKNE